MEQRCTDINEEIDILNIGCEHITGGPLYDHQTDWYWRLESNEFNVATKSRQMGFTFFSAGYYTLKALEGEICLFGSPSLRQSGNVIEYSNKWLHFYEDYFDGMHTYTQEHSKSSIKFENGGALYSLPNSASSIRGIPANRIFLDEFAHFLHGTDREVWEALLPSISAQKTRSVAVVSTPYGEGNLFHKMYVDRIVYPDFKPVFYNYREHPTMDIDTIKKNIDELSFQQEYEGIFVGDITSYFPYSLIQDCENKELSYLTLDEIARLQAPVYGFVDIGKRTDFTSIILVAPINGKLRVIYKKTLKTPEQKEWNNQYAEIRAIMATKKINRLWIDRTGVGDEISTRLAGESLQVVQYEFTNDNKAQMFPAFKKRLENKQIEMVPDISLASALHMIERTQAGGGVVYGSDKHTDEHGHADEAVALVGACWCYETESGAEYRVLGMENTRPDRPPRVTSPRDAAKRIRIPQRRFR